MGEYFKPIANLLPRVSAFAKDGGTISLPIAGLSWASMNGIELVNRLETHGSFESHSQTNSQILTLDEALARSSDKLSALSSSRAPFLSFKFDHPLIMGILNVTPDSFSDGGQYADVSGALQRALSMIEQGADIIDIGGESTRPGAESVSLEDELQRVIPLIEALRSKSEVPISIDTRKSEVMSAAASAGANIINDVSALSFDDQSLAVAASLNIPVILMHSVGTPQTMQDDPNYRSVELDVYDYLSTRIAKAIEAGIARENIVVDPGIGFGKTAAHNCWLLDNLGMLHGLRVPLMLGCSRKSYISKLSRGEPTEERLGGSLAGVLKGVGQGVQIFRVHDVSETSQALKLWFS